MEQIAQENEMRGERERAREREGEGEKKEEALSSSVFERRW